MTLWSIGSIKIDYYYFFIGGGMLSVEYDSSLLLLCFGWVTEEASGP